MISPMMQRYGAMRGNNGTFNLHRKLRKTFFMILKLRATDEEVG